MCLNKIIVVWYKRYVTAKYKAYVARKDTQNEECVSDDDKINLYGKIIGRTLYEGPRGGVYYYGGTGYKKYVTAEYKEYFKQNRKQKSISNSNDDSNDDSYDNEESIYEDDEDDERKNGSLLSFNLSNVVKTEISSCSLTNIYEQAKFTGVSR